MAAHLGVVLRPSDRGIDFVAHAAPLAHLWRQQRRTLDASTSHCMTAVVPGVERAGRVARPHLVGRKVQRIPPAHGLPSATRQLAAARHRKQPSSKGPRQRGVQPCSDEGPGRMVPLFKRLLLNIKILLGNFQTIVVVANKKVPLGNFQTIVVVARTRRTRGLLA